MTKDIFEAYVDDGWHIFKLYRSKDGKGNAVKGMYATPKGWNDTSLPQVKYSDKAIYGGVPPEDIVCIDWDVKDGQKQGDKSFEQLQKDLGVTLETQVMTPSGGGHCYVRLKNLPEDTPKLRKSQDKYPDIDFQSHGSEFVVLGGQTVEGYGTYAWTDEDFEYFVNEAVDFSSLELRKDRVRGEGYESVDIDVHFMSRPSEEEVKHMLNNLDPSMPYDEWASVLMALNSWDLNGENGLKLAIEWSLQSDKHDSTVEDITEKYNMCVSDTPEFYNKLFTLDKKAKEKKDKSLLENIREDLGTIETLEALEQLGLVIQGTRMKVREREEFIDLFCVKSKELGYKPEKVKWKKLLHYVDHAKAEQRQEEALDGMPDYVNTKTGVKYLNTYANLKYFMLNFSKLKFVYDPILKRIIVDDDYSIDVKLSVSYSKLSDELTRMGLPSNILGSHFDATVSDLQHNALIEHIENLPKWDGERDYIGEIADTLTTKSASKEYKRAAIESFVIQAVAAWDAKRRTKHRLSRLENVLTFVGKQGGGKTTWVGELMPKFMNYYFKDGVELDPSNKDSYIQATSAGLVELGELDATTRKSDIASLKAFLSNTQDEFRAPYGRFSERYLRQTVFVGTVNTPDFLKDATGSRRFLVLDVMDVKLPEAEIVEGMWAQAFALYLANTDWRLSSKYEAMRKEVNNCFTDVGMVGDIAEEFMKAVGTSKASKQRYSITRIAQELKLKLSSRERSDFASALAQHGLERNEQGKYYLPSDVFSEYRQLDTINGFENLDEKDEF